MIFLIVAFAFLFAASLIIFHSEVLQAMTTACGFVALGTLLYLLGVLHQTARAWQVFGQKQQRSLRRHWISRINSTGAWILASAKMSVAFEKAIQLRT